jgi:hypothetical protein
MDTHARELERELSQVKSTRQELLNALVDLLPWASAYAKTQRTRLYGDTEFQRITRASEAIAKATAEIGSTAGYVEAAASAVCRCANCGWNGPESALGRPLADLADLGERLDVGGVVPAGECPECEALAYLDTVAIQSRPLTT